MCLRRKSPVRPATLQWALAAEAALLEWSIEARDYNTFAANCAFYLCTSVVLVVTIKCFFMDASILPLYEVMLNAAFILGSIYVVSIGTHQRKRFSYRVTQRGIEYWSWKAPSELLISCFKWFAIFSSIGLLFMVSIEPSALFVALFGSISLGLTYYKLAYSASYRAHETEYQHYLIEWGDITQLAIATNRDVVDLQFIYIPEDNGRLMKCNLNLFCHPRQKAHIASVLKPHLPPGTPFISAKVNVPRSTD